MPRGERESSLNGVSQRQLFCCTCICFLTSALVFQVSVLTVLLRRFFAMHQDVEPLKTGAEAASSPALTVVQETRTDVFLGAPRSRSAGAAGGGTSGKHLALGCAVGFGSDSILLYLASMLKTSRCDVVLLVDSPVPNSILEAEGLDPARVKFELVERPFPAPWDVLSLTHARYWLYKDFLERSQAVSGYELVQISDVDDVVFQVDAFAWASSPKELAGGVHAFVDEPATWSNEEVETSTKCYADQASRLTTLASLAEGYVIGSTQHVLLYLKSMVTELAAHEDCLDERAEKVIHNYVMRSAPMGLKVTVQDKLVGPVWIGGGEASGPLKLDPSSGFLLHENGSPYAVIHRYEQHQYQDLHENLHRAFLRKPLDIEVGNSCGPFQVRSGDIEGFDLDHIEVDTVEECCKACTGDCGGFAFSASRRHCWMKSGVTRTARRPDGDMMCGIRVA